MHNGSSNKVCNMNAMVSSVNGTIKLLDSKQCSSNSFYIDVDGVDDRSDVDGWDSDEVECWKTLNMKDLCRESFLLTMPSYFSMDRSKQTHIAISIDETYGE